jgi:hypothetical protein
VQLDPSNFVATIDNSYWPMKPGNRWVYEETEPGETQRVEVTVTDQTKAIVGVRATVVHDVVTLNGSVLEDTTDWYGQDTAGNIWYLGEDTTTFDNGNTSKEGSWEAGVYRAQAGVIMAAAPQPGMSFRQEYFNGHAEDEVKILDVDAAAQVPFGSLDHVLQTEDTMPLEPHLVEHKYYPKGVGPVLIRNMSTSGTREQLVEFAPSPSRSEVQHRRRPPVLAATSTGELGDVARQRSRGGQIQDEGGGAAAGAVDGAAPTAGAIVTAMPTKTRKQRMIASLHRPAITARRPSQRGGRGVVSVHRASIRRQAPEHRDIRQGNFLRRQALNSCFERRVMIR